MKRCYISEIVLSDLLLYPTICSIYIYIYIFFFFN